MACLQPSKTLLPTTRLQFTNREMAGVQLTSACLQVPVQRVRVVMEVKSNPQLDSLAQCDLDGDGHKVLEMFGKER